MIRTRDIYLATRDSEKGIARFLVISIFVLVVIYVSAVRFTNVDNQYFNLTGGLDYAKPIISGEWKLFFSFICLMVSFARPGVSLRVAPFWAFFLSLCFLSLFWSTAPNDTFSGVLDVYILTFLPLFVVRYLGRKDAMTALWKVGAVIVILSFLFSLAGSDYTTMKGSHLGLWRGFFNHKNVYAPFCTAVILLSLFGGHLIDVRKSARLFVCAIAALSLAFAESKTAFVSILFCVLIYKINSVSIKSRGLRFVLFSSAVILLMFSGYYIFIIEYANFDGDIDFTLTGRTALWNVLLPLSFERVFGFGFRTSGGEFALTLLRSAWANARSGHNTFLTLALDLGWAVSIMFVLYYMSKTIIFNVSSDFRTQKLLSCMATLQLITGMSEVQGAPYFGYHWVAFMTVLYALREGDLAGGEHKSGRAQLPVPSERREETSS